MPINLNAFSFLKRSFLFYGIKCYHLHKYRHIATINRQSTIYGLSSGFGKCGVAVIRISGPHSKLALQKLLMRNETKYPSPRAASLRKLFDPESDELIDKALVLWFPGPHSFTGEDSSELHVHGGPAVVAATLLALSKIPGLRPAQAGEFTKQAFLNNKLDLVEVEGLGDLIHAETELQRKQALRQMEGALGQIYSDWRTRLIKCLANVEAYIDFSEEENIEDGILQQVQKDVSEIQKELHKHLTNRRRGERLRDGLHVAILGEPNVGKSSLLNIICERPAAIVSPIAGTTRDVIETAVNIAGYPVLFSDTAGLRETTDQVEQEGVNRALALASKADLKIIMLNAPESLKFPNKDSLFRYLKEYIISLGVLKPTKDIELNFYNEYKNEIRGNDSLVSQNRRDVNDCVDSFGSKSFDFQHNLEDTLVVFNKTDLLNAKGQRLENGDSYKCYVSCSTGDGIENFIKILVERIKDLCGDPSTDPPSLTQSRHRHHISQCLLHLDEFLVVSIHDIVLAGEQLRLATRELGQVTGRISSEDVLDVVFRDFCIGK